jgi:hypothetical protein
LYYNHRTGGSDVEAMRRVKESRNTYIRERVRKAELQGLALDKIIIQKCILNVKVWGVWDGFNWMKTESTDIKRCGGY